MDNHPLTQAQHADEKDEIGEERGVKYHRRERVVGSFNRQFQLSPLTQAANLTATFTDGVLKVTVAKVAGNDAGKESAHCFPECIRVIALGTRILQQSLNGLRQMIYPLDEGYRAFRVCLMQLARWLHSLIMCLIYTRWF